MGTNAAGIETPAKFWHNKRGAARIDPRMDLESGCMVTWLLSQGETELTGPQRLLLAILQDTALSLARKKNQTWEKDVNEFRDSLRWIEGKYESAPGCSFEEVCLELNYDADWMRKGLYRVANDRGPTSTKLLTIRGRQFGNFRARMSA